MHWHLAWHQTLIRVEAGDSEGAFRVFQDQIGPAVSDAPPINVVSDGASLLWRLALDGREIPHTEWDAIADYGDRRVPTAGNHFIDLHYVLAAAAIGERRGSNAACPISKRSTRMASSRPAPSRSGSATAHVPWRPPTTRRPSAFSSR